MKFQITVSFVGSVLVLSGTRLATARTSVGAAEPSNSAPKRLTYNDGTAEARRSIAGAAELVAFTLPKEDVMVTAIRIHGSRYGYPQPPNEDFTIYFVTDDLSAIAAERKAPYSRFKRGSQEWVENEFPQPIKSAEEVLGRSRFSRRAH